MTSDTTTQPYNEQWEDPSTHTDKYPPDWTARCHLAFENDEYTCQNCGWEDTAYTNTETDSDGDARELRGKHIVPPEQNGTNTISNIATLCSECYPPDAEYKQSGESAEEVPPTAVREGEEQAVASQPQRKKDVFASVDWFAPPNADADNYTAYQLILRMALMLSVVGIGVVMLYQIIVGIHSVLNTLTLSYPVVVYSVLLGGVGCIGWIVHMFGEEATLNGSDPPGTYQRLMGGAVLLMGVAVLAHHTLGSYVLPSLGASGEVYGTVGYIAIFMVYGIGALVSIAVGIVGTLDMRYKFEADVIPAVWTMLFLAPPVIHVWTWGIAGTPYSITEAVSYAFPGLGTISRKTVLDVLFVLLPGVSVAYLIRARHVIRNFRKQNR